MDTSSSDSSDSEADFSPRNESVQFKNEVIHPVNTVKKSGPNSGITLDEVNSMVREYEKQEKRERKVDARKLAAKETVTLTAEDFAKITLTKKQINQLKPKKPRSDAQIEANKVLVARLKEKAAVRKAAKEAADKTLDVREDKSKPGIQVKIAPKQYRARKKAQEPEPAEEEEEDEPEVFKPSRGFQGRKPKVDVEPEEDEVERKVEKLNKLNNVLASSNPFLAQVLASRGVRY